MNKSDRRYVCDRVDEIATQKDRVVQQRFRKKEIPIHVRLTKLVKSGKIKVITQKEIKEIIISSIKRQQGSLGYFSYNDLCPGLTEIYNKLSNEKRERKEYFVISYRIRDRVTQIKDQIMLGNDNEEALKILKEFQVEKF